ncbi:MAG TPA: 3'(2'),5'-bisphosphate nucleotidase CysQ [Candidatus Saccharimonadales bacterium]|nr:3'(2'),5'-bisphosphate nucleotidase CysQ [Candidatus Saccharimonadales bacterium]
MPPVQERLPELLALVREADKAIMEIYAAHSAVVTTKADNSPITQADVASHHILIKGLARLFPGVPVISEEGDEREQIAATTFWLIDPIDGTREFINRTDEFTVCVGLVVGGEPVFGIISAPAYQTVYYGGPTMGSYKQVAEGEARAIHVSPSRLGVVLGSRSHPDEATDRYIAEHYPAAEIRSVGSQLKLTHVAEGLADAYPRMDSYLHSWDLAAGHAILLGAGGKLQRPDGSAITYDSSRSSMGSFVASS